MGVARVPLASSTGDHADDVPRTCAGRVRTHPLTKTAPCPSPASRTTPTGLTVTDIDRSRDFYDTVFGFDVAVRLPADADEKTRQDLRFSSAVSATTSKADSWDYAPPLRPENRSPPTMSASTTSALPSPMSTPCTPPPPSSTSSE